MKSGQGMGSLEKFLGQRFICVFMHQNHLVYFKKCRILVPNPTNESESLRDEAQESAFPSASYISQSLKKKLVH